MSALGNLLLLPLVWVGVSLVLSRMSGWSRLGEQYVARGGASGHVERTSGVVGASRYKNALKIAGDSRGLHLSVLGLFRIGHPPLHIPWSALETKRDSRRGWGETLIFEVRGVGTRIEVKRRVGERALAAKSGG